MTVASCTAAASLAVSAQAAPAARAIHLTAGQYVQADTACKGAPFAAMRMWDGNAFSDPHSSQCKTRIVRRAGQTYTVENVCTANGDGSAAEPSKERLTIQIVNAHTFRLVAPGVRADDKSASYRLCPSTQPSTR